MAKPTTLYEIKGIERSRFLLGDLPPYNCILWYDGPQIWVSEDEDHNKLFVVLVDSNIEERIDRAVVTRVTEEDLVIISDEEIPTPEQIQSIMRSDDNVVFIVDIDWSGEPKRVTETTADKLPESYFPTIGTVNKIHPE